MQLKFHVWNAAVSFLAAGAFLAGTALAQAPTGTSGAAGAKAAAPAGTSGAAGVKPARENGLYATITTSMGPIVVKLYEKESPITVKNFEDLALGRKTWVDPKTNQRVRRPLYTGLIFHRVIPNFMIQGGDPTGTGMGGTDVIPDEFDPSLKFDQPGRLAMANAGPHTGSSQFFITEVPTPHLNGRHTIFGQVVEGMNVVHNIANTPRNGQDKPNTPVKILKITFERVGPGPNPNAAAPAHHATAGKSGAAKSGAAKGATKK